MHREGPDRRVRRRARLARAQPRRRRRSAAQERSVHGRASRCAAGDDGRLNCRCIATWCSWMLPNGRLSVNPLFSWREAIFTKSLAGRAPAMYAARSPLERAVLSLIDPLLVSERSRVSPEKHVQHVVSRFRLEVKRPHGTLVKWIFVSGLSDWQVRSRSLPAEAAVLDLLLRRR